MCRVLDKHAVVAIAGGLDKLEDRLPNLLKRNGFNINKRTIGTAYFGEDNKPADYLYVVAVR